MDLRDLLAQLFSHPEVSLPQVAHMVVQHLRHRWWLLGLGTVAFLCLRHLLMRWKQFKAPLLRTETRTQERRRAKRSLLSSVLLIVVWMTWVFFVFGQLGVTLSPSTIGVLLGTASLSVVPLLQQFVRDMMASRTVVGEDQYGIGDHVDFGFGFEGLVLSIGVRTTKLRGHDGTIFHVRHSEFGGRVGNRTQSSGSLLMDVRLTPLLEHLPSPAEVDDWSQTMVQAAVELRRTLSAVREVMGLRHPTKASLSEVAEVVPALAPNLTDTTMTEMRAIDDVRMEAVATALRKAPAGTTPVLRDVEMLGLVDSTTTSVTLRLRVRVLEQATRSYAAALLRRSIYDAFAERGISAGFDDVPAGEVIN